MKHVLLMAMLALVGGLKASTERLAITFDDNFATSASTIDHFIYGPTEQMPVITHLTTSGESLSLLAKRFYGDSKLWPIIFYDNLGKSDDGGYVWGDKLLTPNWLPTKIPLSIRMHLDDATIVQAKDWCLWYYGLSEKK